jgi:hypothetical protein
MNENNKSFYPSDMFEFIHHPEYGCRNLKELKFLKRISQRLSIDLHSKTWFIPFWYVGDIYGEFHFAGSSGISLQNYIWSSLLNPIFTILNVENVN